MALQRDPTYVAPRMSTHQHVRPWRMIERRKSRKIRVGSVEVGGDAPITVQTMTNTITGDARATIDQIRGSRRPAPTSCASPARTRTPPRR